MISLRALRADPGFAGLFAHVHVTCWPILWWQLNLLRNWCLACNIPDVLYSVSPWGFIKVRRFGKAPDPRSYKPILRTFRPLTDDSWATALPANLQGLTPFSPSPACAGLPGSAIALQSPRQGINDLSLQNTS